MNQEIFLKKYWNYYLLLEEKVIELQKYVDFESDNLKTYSFEIQSKLVMICCEIEAIYKLIVGEEKKNVKEYIEEIMKKQEYKSIRDEQLHMIMFEKICFSPIQLATNMDKNGWWDTYNILKHNRYENNNYKKANLGNLIYALGTLYILEIHYYNNNFYYGRHNECNIPKNISKLFESDKLTPNFFNTNSIRTFDEALEFLPTN